MNKRFNKILEDIKKVKIQGARNIAKAALYAYSLEKTKSAKEKLIHARPTEPMLVNVMNKVDKLGYKKTLAHFDSAQEKINKNVFKIIKNNQRIFTHCHSTNVVNSLIYSKRHGKKFQVYNTETRPLFQGRQTAKELRNSGIKVTQFIDSAMAFAIEKENKKDKIYVNIILLGADAVLKDGVINKIGSGMIAELAKLHHIPLYIVADSWKYSKMPVKIEQRNVNEVWNKAPSNIRIKNPAFEKVPEKYITGIISELGILSFKKFVKKFSY